MNAIGAHVGGDFDFALDNRLLGKAGDGEVRLALGLRNVRIGHATHRANGPRRDAARLIALLENIFQHVHHFGRVGPLQRNEFAHHFRRLDIDLVDDLADRPNDGGAFRHEQAGRLRQRENGRVRAGRAAGQVLGERRLELSRIGEAQFENVRDDTFTRRNFGWIGDDGNAGAPRIFIRADDFDQVGLSRHERETIHEQIGLDNLDRFLAWHIADNVNVHFPLNEIVRDHAFAGECFVNAKHVLHVTVGILEFDGRGTVDRDWRRVRTNGRSRPRNIRRRGQRLHLRDAAR